MNQESSRYRLISLGEWRLEYNGVDIPVRSLKAKALISYLAHSTAQNHSRKKLASMLWPEQSGQKGLGNLRQVLSQIRTATEGLTPLFTAGHSEIQLTEGMLNVDLNRFLTELEAGKLPLGLSNAIENFTDFLVDFQSIGDEFETWSTNLRQSAEKRAIIALVAISETGTVDRKEQLQAAQAAFQLDSFDESAARAIMRGFADLNEISKAVEFYDELCANFETELDVEPSIETQDLAAQIKLTLGGQDVVELDPPPISVSPIAVSSGALDNAIAILPFQSLGPAPVPSYVQLGLMDEITCKLAGTIAPSPLSSNSMRRFLDTPPPSPAEIGQTTGARYVLSGSIRTDGTLAKVAVQMADSTNEQVVWAEVFRSTFDDILNLEIPIARKIVSSFVPSLHGVELGRTRSFGLDDLEPFHLVLRARELIYNLSQETFFKAGAMLQAAIEKGPGFAPGFSALADWHSVCIGQGWSTDAQADQKALEGHAHKAISLNPSDGRTMALLGHNKLIFSRKYEEAQGYFEQAVTNMPGDSETLNWTVPGLTYAGEQKQAIENGETSLRLSPFDPFRFRNQHFLSIAHYADSNYDRAAELGLESFEDNPTYLSNLRFTIASLFASGKTSRAHELADYHREIEPEFQVSKLISKHPFRSEQKRVQYGKHLVDAGLDV